MTNEIVMQHWSGQAVYAVLLNASGTAWTGAAFETPSAANWDDYALAMAEADTTGVYRCDMPAVAAGVYSVIVYRQVGGSPAAGDVLIGAGSIRWTGTEEEGVPAAGITEILEDTSITLPALISAGGSGAGLLSETITVVDGDSNPVDGTLVQVATDGGFSHIIRSGYTNSLGQVTLHFDAAGTYFGRAEIAGYGVATFTVEVMA